MKVARKTPVINEKHITMNKVAHKKPAANKKPVGRVPKKQGTSSTQKKPARYIQYSEGATCYHTIASHHEDGLSVMRQIPCMVIELGATVAWLAGELDH